MRLLHLNAPPTVLKSGSGDDEAYKVLVLDRITKDVVAPLLRINDLRKCASAHPPCPRVQALLALGAAPRALACADRSALMQRCLLTAAAPASCLLNNALRRRHGVTLHLMLEAERQAIPDVPAVYFVRGSEEAVERAVADAAAGLYDSLHLNFTPCLPAPLMQKLAAGAHWGRRRRSELGLCIARTAGCEAAGVRVHLSHCLLQGILAVHAQAAARWRRRPGRLAAFSGAAWNTLTRLLE